ncbi:MAG: GNAT family N-acetyltransferase [Pseudomonadota bacterium]
MECQLAAARPVDPDRIAKLIHSTDPHIFGALHGEDHTLALQHLSKQWQSDAGIFSYRFARAAWMGETLAGICLGFDASQQAAAIEPYILQAQRFLTEEQFGVGFAWWSRHGFLTLPEIPADAWYIQNLAVDDAYRRRGIGEAMLRDCIENAREAAYGRVHLDVYEGNSAIDLHRRMGFDVIVETRVLPLMADGFPAHLRMERVL